MHKVYDGPRILEFEGEELAFSTSERAGSPRWIEFTLYRTAGEGRYVLSRVGVSNVWHGVDCPVAEKNRLRERPVSELGPEAVPCPECAPVATDFPLCRPEVDKAWARDYGDPEGVIRGLTKTNGQGETYLTGVARRLIGDAAAADPAIAGASRVERVL